MSAIQDGGPFVMMVLGLAGFGLLVALGFTGLGAMRRRVPFTAWLLIPVAVAALGAIGTMTGAVTALSAAGEASASMMAPLAHSGWSVGSIPDWIGRWAGAVLLAVSAWGAGLGAMARPDYDNRSTWLAAVATAAAAFSGAVMVSGFTWYYAISSEGYALAALLLFGGLGAALGALRRELHEQAFRVAGMRFAAGLALIFSVSWAGKALVLSDLMEVQLQLARATPTTYATFLEGGLAMHEDVVTVAWIAFAFALVAGIMSFYYELGEVVQKGTLADAVGILALGFGLSLVRAAERTATDDLHALTALGPLSTVVKKYEYELPSSQVQLDGKSYDVRPVVGGFGDVLVLGEAGWKRHYRWEGSVWTEEEEPQALSAITLSPGQAPLLVGMLDQPAKALLEPLEKAGGKAHLLIRQAELNLSAPPELLAREGGLLPLELGGPRDYTKDLWYAADFGFVYKGPVRFFGPGDEERKPFALITKALTAPPPGTEAPSGAETTPPVALEVPSDVRVHVVLGEEAKVKHIVEACLVETTKREGDAYVANDRACPVAMGDREALVEEAAVGWTPSDERSVIITVKPEKGIAPERAELLFEREKAAFAACAAKGGEGTATGKWMLDLVVNAEGIPVAANDHEKSTFADYAMMECGRERLRGMDFGSHTEPEPIHMELTVTWR